MSLGYPEGLEGLKDPVVLYCRYFLVGLADLEDPLDLADLYPLDLEDLEGQPDLEYRVDLASLEDPWDPLDREVRQDLHRLQLTLYLENLIQSKFLLRDPNDNVQLIHS
jgi:hypothetical protein